MTDENFREFFELARQMSEDELAALTEKCALAKSVAEVQYRDSLVRLSVCRACADYFTAERSKNVVAVT